MTHLEKALLIAELADRLIANGSWCGHTHLQKATCFLQEQLGVPLGVEFVLYKHGPYSFDLEEELMWSEAKYLFEPEYKAPGYGPRLKPTQTSVDHRARHRNLLNRYARQIDFVAEAFGKKGVAELEKLATALWVSRSLGRVDDAKLARKIHDLKPHIPFDDALAAVPEFDRIAEQAQAITQPAAQG